MRGRPKKELNKNVIKCMRLSTIEDQFLKELCSKTGKTQTQILRKALLHYYNFKILGMILND